MKKTSISTITFVTLGVFIMALALHFFLIPANLAAGGVSGLSMVINRWFPFLSIGLLLLGFNIALFILGFLVIGRDFGAITIYASLVLSGMIMMLEKIYPVKGTLVDDLMLNMIYGILIQGVGMGVIFNQNASTGGTDILAKIINHYTHLDIGKALFVADFVVTSLAAATFGLKLGLYALLGVIINAVVIDSVIAGFDRKYGVMINSDYLREINDYIINELERGSTIYTVKGGFSGEDKEMIYVLLSRQEYIKVKLLVKSLDPEAFLSVGHVEEVFGEGFKNLA